MFRSVCVLFYLHMYIFCICKYVQKWSWHCAKAISAATSFKIGHDANAKENEWAAAAAKIEIVQFKQIRTNCKNADSVWKRTEAGSTYLEKLSCFVALSSSTAWPKLGRLFIKTFIASCSNSLARVGRCKYFFKKRAQLLNQGWML
jgi:hypothetical protein